jgi:hypothetical protein
MKSKELSDEDVRDFVESLHEIVDDADVYIKKSYDDIMFLGTTVNKLEDNVFESVLINIRVCIYYYLSMEKYRQVDKLNNLYQMIIKEDNKMIEIDQEILKSIIFSLN